MVCWYHITGDALRDRVLDLLLPSLFSSIASIREASAYLAASRYLCCGILATYFEVHISDM